jgi:hypothetical protein
MKKNLKHVLPPILRESAPGTWDFQIEAIGLNPFGNYKISLTHGPREAIILTNDMWTAYTLAGAVKRAKRIKNRVNKQELKVAHKQKLINQILVPNE